MATTQTTLELLPKQVSHFNRVCDILTRYAGYIDTSQTGSGKSYIVMAVAIKFLFPLIVICPKGAIEQWESLAKQYNVHLYAVMTYDTLRSTKGHQPSHGLLARFDDTTKKDKVQFFPTDLLKAILAHGVLIVFDEFHSVKNDSDRHKAASAITRQILLTGGNARFAALSASPFDKEEHAVHVVKFLGLIRYQKMFMTDQATKEFRGLGIEELIQVAKKYDAKTTELILVQFPPAKNTINKLTFRLFSEVILRYIGSTMPPPDIPFEKDVANGYYVMSEQDIMLLTSGIKTLSVATNYDDASRTVDTTNIDLGGITKSLMQIEESKVPTFARLAKAVLDGNSKAKVIIYVNYKDTINKLSTLLQQYSPMTMQGKDSQKTRDQIRITFNESPYFRVLISNTIVGGQSINLHDTVGDAPRTVFISPSYSIIQLHQATGRVHRVGLKSKATIRFVFGKEASKEMHILDALARKKDVLRSVILKPIEEDEEYDAPNERVLLPGEYPEFIEE